MILHAGGSDKKNRCPVRGDRKDDCSCFAESYEKGAGGYGESQKSAPAASWQADINAYSTK